MTDGDKGIRGKASLRHLTPRLHGNRRAAEEGQASKRKHRVPGGAECCLSLGVLLEVYGEQNRGCTGHPGGAWAREGPHGCTPKARRLLPPAGKWLLLPASKRHESEGVTWSPRPREPAHFPTAPCEKEDAVTRTIREHLTSSKNCVASRASDGEKYFDAVNMKSPSGRS